MKAHVWVEREKAIKKGVEVMVVCSSPISSILADGVLL